MTQVGGNDAARNAKQRSLRENAATRIQAIGRGYGTRARCATQRRAQYTTTANAHLEQKKTRSKPETGSDEQGATGDADPRDSCMAVERSATLDQRRNQDIDARTAELIAAIVDKRIKVRRALIVSLMWCPLLRFGQVILLTAVGCTAR